MIVLTIIVIALSVAALLVGLGRTVPAESSGSGIDVDRDVDRAEHWLLVHAPSRLTGVLRSADRRVAGGVAVVVSFAAVFIGATVVGWIFSGLDDQRGVARWDVAAAEYGRDHATSASTSVLRTITDLGGTTLLFGLMVVLGVHHTIRRRDWGVALYLAVVGVGVTALNNGLKLLVDRDRPAIAQLAGHAGSAFPSGHSAAAAACWAAMALVATRRLRPSLRLVGGVVAIAVAVAVATTRVLLGVHWLSDVVAGVVVGWSWFAVSTIVFGGRLFRLGEPAERLTAQHDTDGALTDADTMTSLDRGVPDRWENRHRTDATSRESVSS